MRLERRLTLDDPEDEHKGIVVEVQLNWLGCMVGLLGRCFSEGQTILYPKDWGAEDSLLEQGAGLLGNF